MCVSPQAIRYTKFQKDFIASVPCNNCYECVRKRKLDWEIRLTVESSASAHTFFGMLTFSDLFYHSDVDKTEIQYYFKRLRYNLNKFYPGAKLKYFIVSELGELKDRLHYHVLYFLSPEFTDTFREFQELCKLSWVKKVPLTPEEILYRKQVYRNYMLRPRKLRSSEKRKELFAWSRRKYDDMSLGFVSAQMLRHGSAVGSIHYACKYIQKQYNRMFHSRVGFAAWRDYLVKTGQLVPNYNRKLDVSVPICFHKYLYEYKGSEYPTFPIRGKLYPVPKSWCLNTFGKYYTYYLRRSLVLKVLEDSKNKTPDYDRQNFFEYKEPERMALIAQRYTDSLLSRRQLAVSRDDFHFNELEWQTSMIRNPSLPCQGVQNLTYPTELHLPLKWPS